MLTFKEFYQICEGKKPSTPPHAVPGTFQTHRDPQTGQVTHTSYTLEPGPSGKLKKPKPEDIKKLVLNRSGGKKVKKEIKRSEREAKNIKENIEQLRKGLETLERQSAPKQRLAARRAAAKQRSRTLASDFQRRQKEKMRAQRERMQQREELQLEQTPTMKPNLYSQLVARRQASQKSAIIKHAHQEMGAEARAQEAAHQRRLSKLTGTP